MDPTLIFISIILVIMVVIIIILLFWLVRSSQYTSDPNYQSEDDIKLIRNTIIYDSHLQRLLMIEIINNSLNESSETITFNRIAHGTSILSKSLTRSFGTSNTQRLSNLFTKRNDILREYYRSMRNVICKDGICVQEIDPSKDSILKMFPSDPKALENLDITVINQRKLENLSNEIIEFITSLYQTKGSELLNLMNLYNKELLNQAKLYASKHYDISMNCFQNSYELSYHIINELTLMINSYIPRKIMMY